MRTRCEADFGLSNSQRHCAVTSQLRFGTRHAHRRGPVPPYPVLAQVEHALWIDGTVSPTVASQSMLRRPRVRGRFEVRSTKLRNRRLGQEQMRRPQPGAALRRCRRGRGDAAERPDGVPRHQQVRSAGDRSVEHRRHPRLVHRAAESADRHRVHQVARRRPRLRLARCRLRHRLADLHESRLRHAIAARRDRPLERVHRPRPEHPGPRRRAEGRPGSRSRWPRRVEPRLAAIRSVRFGSLAGAVEVSAGADQGSSEAAFCDLDRRCDVGGDGVDELAVHDARWRGGEFERGR